MLGICASIQTPLTPAHFHFYIQTTQDHHRQIINTTCLTAGVAVDDLKFTLEMERRIDTLPVSLQMQIATYANPTLPKTLRIAIQDHRLNRCGNCMWRRSYDDEPDDEYFALECSCPAQDQVFRSLSMEDMAHDRQCEEDELQKQREANTKEFKLLLDWLGRDAIQKEFNEEVQRAIAAEASPEVQADRAEMMAFCASVYQRKMEQVSRSEEFQSHVLLERTFGLLVE